ncbi:V-set and immunoglobulin domain-containing protein 10 isoform 2-T2 [Pholidichthys leucotaenia]
MVRHVLTTAATLLHLCAAVSLNGSTETVVTAAPGDVVLLPCYTDGVVSPAVTKWEKNGREVVPGGGPSAQRLAVQHDGSLSFDGVMPGDEGTYLCNSTLPDNSTVHARVLLQLAGGPEKVLTTIQPTTVLPNGTLTTYLGASVIFNCSSSSYPSPQLTWAFRGASSSNNSLVSTRGSWLDFRIEEVQPVHQGVYSCNAQNSISRQSVNKSTQLLVYYVSDRHPECMWATLPDSSVVKFKCSWFGSYPTPQLRWRESDSFTVTDSLTVTMNRSILTEGQTVKCTAQHQLLGPGKEKSCFFVLKGPYPVGDPMVAALEGRSVTLSCSDNMSIPPANTTWRKGMKQDYIVPGSKYILSQDGPVFKLTIVNVSKDDEGVYFCHSENPLAARELEVYLTVKTSLDYTGAIIGVFIAALILGSSIMIARTLYSNRHRICLGNFTL